MASVPPASTIMMAMSPPSIWRPATTSSKVDSVLSSNVGCAIHSPPWRDRRTAPIGPSNGMPETVSAADAPLIDSTSCGFTRSAPMMVATTCTSLRKPSGKLGRSGRSVRRQVRMAGSPGRPSRRKTPPGIFPAAYMRSSTSTVNGKKSMPSRGFDVTTVLRMVVSPTRTSTAPSAWGASLPVSRVISSPAALMGPATRIASAMGTLPLSPFLGDRRGGAIPSCRRPDAPVRREVARAVATDNRRRARGVVVLLVLVRTTGAGRAWRSARGTARRRCAAGSRAADAADPRA